MTDSICSDGGELEMTKATDVSSLKEGRGDGGQMEAADIHCRDVLE